MYIIGLYLATLNIPAQKRLANPESTYLGNHTMKCSQFL